MAKSQNQKLKLLYIIKILKEDTDENHPISTKELIKKLADYEISVERKTIYTDMELLSLFGYDIEKIKIADGNGYYLASDIFEAAEVKLLVDMIQSSKFLSVKKSTSLIKKLESLTNKYEASMLNRSVYVQDRAKSENETIYYNIDYIHRAINENKSISFQYQKYTVDKELMLRKGGAKYEVSPYYLISNAENYYLVAYDNLSGIIKNYRVDRIKSISVMDESRVGKKEFEKFDIVKYSAATFSMFSGSDEPVRITMRFANEMVSVVIDRFGKEVSIFKVDDGYFTITASIYPSPQFYGWLAGLNGKAFIEGPLDIKEAYHDYLGNLYKLSE